MIVEILAGRGVERVMIDSCGRTYEDLLLALKINPETVVVLAEGGPVPLDGEICGEKVTIIRVVSSG
jgi:sulfur carrier protein ThiS